MSRFTLSALWIVLINCILEHAAARPTYVNSDACPHSMDSSMSDARALSYHDVVLRRADVELLRGPHWLNDQIIAFFFEYLMHDVHPTLSSRAALMPGAATFLLLNSDPAEAAVIFEALELHEKDLVVFAVNDNPDVEWAAGGAHWSCLAYHRATNSFRHYDSSAPHNRKVARSLAGAATPLLRTRSSSSSNDSSSAAMHPAFVEVAATPQQQNSNDCGVYVLAVAQQLCGSFAQAQQQQQQDGSAVEACCWRLSEEQETELLQSISPAGVASMRGELLSVIESLAQRPSADSSAN